MKDKSLQKNIKQLIISRVKKVVLFLLWSLLLMFGCLLFLVKKSIVGFLISLFLAHEFWKKLVKTNRKIKILKMAIYFRELELKKKDFDPKHPQLQEIIKILTPKK